MNDRSRPDVSVVIPTHDRPALLRRALASVERQAFRSLEIVVVDDGDGSGAALAAQSAARPLRTVDNARRGQVAARNRGIAAATGRFIAFLDDDDWWDDDAYLGAMLAAVPPSGLAYASGLIVPEGPGAAGAAAMPFWARADARSIRQDNMLLVSGIVYDRSLHERLGAFDADLPIYWDWDWYLRLFAAGAAFRAAASAAVRISARRDTTSAPVNQDFRRDNLALLCRKHGLTGIVLRNHESIARDQNAAATAEGTSA